MAEYRTLTELRKAKGEAWRAHQQALKNRQAITNSKSPASVRNQDFGEAHKEVLATYGRWEALRTAENNWVKAKSIQ